MHSRQKIRSTLLTLLKGNTDAGERVFVNPVHNHQDENLPEIAIHYVSESPIEETSVAPIEYQRTLNLMVEAVASGKTSQELTDTLDQLTDQIEQIVIPENLIKFSGLEVDRVKLSGVDFEFRGDGETPIGSVRTEVSVLYRSFVREAIATDDFEKASIDWNIDKTNDDDDPNNDIVVEAEDELDIPTD